MSSDLIAAFGEAATNDDLGESATSATGGDVGESATSAADNDVREAATYAADDNSADDDFGDFEDASAATTFSRPPPLATAPASPLATGRHPFANQMHLLFDAGDDEYDAGADDLDDLARNPEAAREFSKRVIAEQHETNDVSDFGDFEMAPAASSVAAPASSVAASASASPLNISLSRMPRIDLLGLGDEIAVPNILSPRSERASSILGHAKADSMSRPKASGLVLQQQEDAWDDFETADPVSVPPLAPTAHRKTPDELPPMNVPPPIILLSAFSSLFSTAQDALFAPLSQLQVAQRSRLLAHPATHQFLASHLKSTHVLAHIIAGRRLRWKRDMMLSQSMRIGPSAAGRQGGGMKLTSIDKSEADKEDREVLDTVQRWKAQAGRLRSAVSTANRTPRTGPGTRKLPCMPEIADSMPVKALKATENGFVAPRACALCGLKREERVVNVDVLVNDSFGEWWIDNSSMHVFCKEWWDENAGKLRGR